MPDEIMEWTDFYWPQSTLPEMPDVDRELLDWADQVIEAYEHWQFDDEDDEEIGADWDLMADWDLDGDEDDDADDAVDEC